MAKHWETPGKTDEWYTPAYIFESLGEYFDLDVASPEQTTHVPAARNYTASSLELPWEGFIWMNPPFGGPNGLVPWLDKFFQHGNGIALTPDRSSADWWQDAALRADAMLMTRGRIKFERPDGSVGKSPSNGTTLFAAGDRAVAALVRSNLGIVTQRI